MKQEFHESLSSIGCRFTLHLILVLYDYMLNVIEIYIGKSERTNIYQTVTAITYICNNFHSLLVDILSSFYVRYKRAKWSLWLM